MSSLKAKFSLLLVLALVAAVVAGIVIYKYYDFVFAKTVTGEIVGVEHVNTNETIIMGGANVPASQIFSFAVAVRDRKGEIHTASSEDRQWAVAQKGQCAEAKFYPYPPWDLAKWGTYHGARLTHLFDCPEAPNKAPVPAPASPVPQGSPAG